VAADQGEHHVLALVQRRERADAERGRVVGYEQDGARVGGRSGRAHSASSYAATVARPHCAHVKLASTFARAAAPSASRSAIAVRIASASPSTSPASTSVMPPPDAAI